MRVIRPIGRTMQEGVRQVILDPTCPRCGGPRGEPKLVNLDMARRPRFQQRKVHVWENPCGHPDPELE